MKFIYFDIKYVLQLLINSNDKELTRILHNISLKV